MKNVISFTIQDCRNAQSVIGTDQQANRQMGGTHHSVSVPQQRFSPESIDVEDCRKHRQKLYDINATGNYQVDSFTLQPKTPHE